MTIEDFITSTPQTLEDGGLILGSKKTSVFELDLKSGRLIRTYTSTDSLSTLEGYEDPTVNCETSATTSNELLDSASTNQNPANMRLHIMRTDYILKSFPPGSNKVSWNMSVAEIGAALLCQDVHNLLNWKDNIGDDIALPLPCQSKASIFRYKHHMLLELPKLERLAGAHDQDVMLPGLVSNPMLPVQLKENVHNCDSMVENNYSGLEDEQNLRIHPDDISSKLFGWSSGLSLTLFIIFLLGIVAYRHALLILRKVALLHEQPRNSNKKKKSRKLDGTVDKKDQQVLSDNEESESDNKTWLDLNKLVDCGVEGRRIGRLFVSNREIAKGSNGTIVVEGIYEGRPVAVKRLVQAHHDVAFKEIQNLIASDQHPNIVRWYGVECDHDFVYLSLERCTCSLDDLIQIYSDSSQYSASAEDHAMRSTTEYKVRLDSLKNIMPDVKIWKANGYPSPLLLKLMRFVRSFINPL